MGTFLGLGDGAWVAIFTLALVVVGAIQFLQLKRTNDSTASVERAYVKMSHEGNGLVVNPEKKVARVKIQVKNFGHTPAQVTDALLVWKVLDEKERLPTKPDYANDPSREAPKAFLVTDDDFSYWQPLPVPDWSLIKENKKKLYVYGYVDYIDAFGRRFRGGYASLYKPLRDDPRTYGGNEQAYLTRNNLVFVTQEGYNYDRPRTVDEGNDWNLLV